MPSNTWTPAGLSSDARALSGVCWRVVESQHHVSTLKLVDTLDEQAVLEELIERTKPVLPTECAGLDYLLATPFRYGAPYPRGSRFRRAGLTTGVFYASESSETAIAETAFYRLLFFAESPNTPWPANPGEYTAFSVKYRTTRALDLTRDKYRKHSALKSLNDYTSCQALADAAREARIQVIRYQSVRDPAAGNNVALLTCLAFATSKPQTQQTWRIRLSGSGVQALCETTRSGLMFARDAFARDPRIKALRWER